MLNEGAAHTLTSVGGSQRHPGDLVGRRVVASPQQGPYQLDARRPVGHADAESGSAIKVANKGGAKAGVLSHWRAKELLDFGGQAEPGRDVFRSGGLHDQFAPYPSMPVMVCRYMPASPRHAAGPRPAVLVDQAVEPIPAHHFACRDGR
jgi:hypothetical protein